MNSKNEYKSKIRLLTERLSNYKEKSKNQSAEIATLKRQLRETRKSRRDWKEKAKERRSEVKSLSARLSRSVVPRHHYPMFIIQLCVMLRLFGGCSYRSISRSLAVINICFKLGMEKVPCANSIENWVAKMGYSRLEDAGAGLASEDVCLIVDECSGAGREKVLLVLACPAKKEGKAAIRLTDTRVCYMHGQKSWTSEQINDVLVKVSSENTFNVRYILSDQASVMCKAARLHGKGHAIDIGHALATCLRRTFKEDEGYVAFSKLVSSYQQKAVNRDLSYLRPPRQKVNARFMNLRPVVEWARRMLEKFDELDDAQMEFFAELPQHKHSVRTLWSCLGIAGIIGTMFKQEGLCKLTFQQASIIIAYLSFADGKIGCFAKLVGGYLAKYEAFMGLSDEAFNVSSDIIESLFAKYKNVTKYTPYMGLSMVCLEFPAYSLKQVQILPALKKALEEVFIQDLKEWNISKSSVNQAAMRREFFKKH